MDNDSRPKYNKDKRRKPKKPDNSEEKVKIKFIFTDREVDKIIKYKDLPELLERAKKDKKYKYCWIVPDLSHK